jgi:GNAT superfamily N-acetyltransferase
MKWSQFTTDAKRNMTIYFMDRRWIVRHVNTNEFEPWTQLFRGYCDFYSCPTSDEHQRQIWSWIHDTKCVEALVAVEVDDDQNEIDVPRGLAHLRELVRPLRGAKGGYLDDLFVDPSRRGSGAVDALFSAINDIALAREWSIVRWTTAEDNARAQAAYNKIAARTSWVTYDMTPHEK